MDLTLDSLQVDAFTASLQGDSTDNKTALHLMENLHGGRQNPTQENPPKMIELVIDEKEKTMTVSGAAGPVKIFNHTRKLLLIQTAKDNQATFKISHLKKGRYLLEAEHQFFEFVR